MSSVEIPHLSLPLRFVPGQSKRMSAAVTEQDSMDEIADCVLAILLCPQGFRVELPEFGIPDPAFTDVDLEQLREQIEEWEPRADAELSDGHIGELVAQVQVLLRLRSAD